MDMNPVDDHLSNSYLKSDGLLHASILFFLTLLGGYIYFRRVDPLGQAFAFLIIGPIVALFFLFLFGMSLYSLKKSKDSVKEARKFGPLIVNCFTPVLCLVIWFLPPAHYMNDNYIEVITNEASPAGTKLIITYIVDLGATGQSGELHSVIPATSKDFNLAEYRLPSWAVNPKWIDETTIEVSLMKGIQRPSSHELKTGNWFGPVIKLQIAK
jgi:hypothetical protein